MKKRLSEHARRHVGETLTIRWGVSRGRNTYGYTTCSLRNGSGKRLAACNGGGYDMEGTVVGDWVARTFREELLALKEGDFPDRRTGRREGGPELYGLTFHDPDYDPGKATIGQDCHDRTLGTGSKGQTVEEAEAAGTSLGLERYQAFYAASSPVPTSRHRIPLIDGACGLSSVLAILRRIGLDLRQVTHSSKLDTYEVVRASDD
jgi:hypothetical protein